MRNTDFSVCTAPIVGGGTDADDESASGDDRAHPSSPVRSRRAVPRRVARSAPGGSLRVASAQSAPVPDEEASLGALLLSVGLGSYLKPLAKAGVTDVVGLRCHSVSELQQSLAREHVMKGSFTFSTSERGRLIKLGLVDTVIPTFELR